jgi:hypothetical protein
MSWRYSGGASNSDAAASLGGAMSSVEVVETLNGLFDDVSGAESEAGDTEYRCVYYINETGGTLENVHAYIQSDASGDDALAIALDLAGEDGTADTVADESTAPDPAVTWDTGADYASGIDLGDLEDDHYYAIWVRRTVPSAASAGTSSWTIRARGESAA